MSNRELVLDALSKTEDELLTELGAILTGADTASLKDGEAEGLQQRARNWLERMHSRLAELICDHPAVQAVRGDTVAEACAVADIILQNWFRTAGAITAAAIIIKLGLNRLCGGQQPDGHDQPVEAGE